MLKGQVHLSKTSAPINTTQIKSFNVIQNNHHGVVHEVEFERNGSTRRMLFLNGVEAILKGSRYIQAQSKAGFCATLVLTPDETNTNTPDELLSSESDS